MAEFSCVTASAAQTRALARALGRRLRPGDWVALSGPLGAGKTTFTAGLAEGLGVAGEVSSPTYLLCHEYEGPVTLLHLDAYFAERMEGLLAEGLAERLHGPVVVVVEWAERMAEWLPAEHLEVRLGHPAPSGDGTRRAVTVRGPADRLTGLARP